MSIWHTSFHACWSIAIIPTKHVITTLIGLFLNVFIQAERLTGIVKLQKCRKLFHSFTTVVEHRSVATVLLESLLVLFLQWNALVLLLQWNTFILLLQVNAKAWLCTFWLENLSDAKI